MRTGLWVVIVLVTGIVGFLVGYSVSSYTGLRKLGDAQASDHGAAPAKPAAQAAAPAPAAAPAGGYGAVEKPAASGGYGAVQKAAAPAAPAAGGYGAPAKPASPVKPAAAGY